jgi:hypothetical protein
MYKSITLCQNIHYSRLWLRCLLFQPFFLEVPRKCSTKFFTILYKIPSASQRMVTADNGSVIETLKGVEYKQDKVSYIANILKRCDNSLKLVCLEEHLQFEKQGCLERKNIEPFVEEESRNMGNSEQFLQP